MGELTKRRLSFDAEAWRANADYNSIRVFIVKDNIQIGYSPITEPERFKSALDELV